MSLHGQSQQDDDIYLMVDAGSQALTFTIQDGTAGDWKRVIDTSLESPDDCREPGKEIAFQSLSYEVSPRSMAVFIRQTQD